MEAAAASFGWDEALPRPLPQPCILEAQGPGPPGSSRCFCILCPKSTALQGELDGPAKTRVPSGLRAQPKHLHRAVVCPSHFLKFYFRLICTLCLVDFGTWHTAPENTTALMQGPQDMEVSVDSTVHKAPRLFETYFR